MGNDLKYAFADVDVSAPLPRVELRPDERGLALVVRRAGRPVDLILHELPAGASLGADEIERLIAAESAPSLLQQAIREELRGPRRAAPVRLTIAVCTRDRVGDLADCLRSVVALRPTANDAVVDLLVVDNAPSNRATEALVEAIPDARYAREPCPGLDFARNRALAEARGDYVAFVDDDVVVDQEWLRGLAEALAENPDAAIVNGLVLPFELRSRAQLIFERRGGFSRGFDTLRFEGGHRPGNTLYPLGAGVFGAGANMVVRRDAVLALGGFDEALDTGPPLPGGGDLDIFYRVARAGLPLVYEPRMVVFHKHRDSHAALRRQYWTWGTGFMAFVAKVHRLYPDERSTVRRLVLWWYKARLDDLLLGVRGRGPLTPDLVLAEAVGGAVGLLGSYRRSQRRTRRIRDAYA